MSAQVIRGPSPRGFLVTYSQYPPAWLQLVQHHACLLRLNSVDILIVREAFAKVDHALGQANLPQPLIALGLWQIFRGPYSRTALSLCIRSATFCTSGFDGRIVDDLVIECLVTVAQAGIEDGQEPNMGRYYRGWRGGRAGRHCILVGRADATLLRVAPAEGVVCLKVGLWRALQPRLRRCLFLQGEEVVVVATTEVTSSREVLAGISIHWSNFGTWSLGAQWRHDL